MEEKDKQPEQSEDVQAHIRSRGLNEDAEPTDEHELRGGRQRSEDGDDDVEAHWAHRGK
jgi:hypothetical protein